MQLPRMGSTTPSREASPLAGRVCPWDGGWLGWEAPQEGSWLSAPVLGTQMTQRHREAEQTDNQVPTHFQSSHCLPSPPAHGHRCPFPLGHLPGLFPWPISSSVSLRCEEGSWNGTRGPCHSLLSPGPAACALQMSKGLEGMRAGRSQVTETDPRWLQEPSEPRGRGRGRGLRPRVK